MIRKSIIHVDSEDIGLEDEEEMEEIGEEEGDRDRHVHDDDNDDDFDDDDIREALAQVSLYIFYIYSLCSLYI